MAENWEMDNDNAVAVVVVDVARGIWCREGPAGAADIKLQRLGVKVQAAVHHEGSFVTEGRCSAVCSTTTYSACVHMGRTGRFSGPGPQL